MHQYCGSLASFVLLPFLVLLVLHPQPAAAQISTANPYSIKVTLSATLGGPLDRGLLVRAEVR